MSDAARNVLTVWARLIAASLVSAGVRDVVVSPGSRSTPFVLALHRRSELRLTSVLDERSAAFVALGIGRATGRPAAVLATSGTAPAHWMPAVIEASLTHVPLLLLSANRPLALASSGAAQTIDQTKLFGAWVRLFLDLGDPSAEQGALEGVVRHVTHAVAAAHDGPVHLDLHADKPLEPVEPVTDIEHALVVRAAELEKRGTPKIGRATLGADEEFAGSLAQALSMARRPLVVAGPRLADDADAIRDACARMELIASAEATSQLRFGARRGGVLDASELVFSSARFASDHAPDLVVQIGSLPTAPTLERVWSEIPRFVLDAGGIHDPIGRAAAISTAPAGATLTRTAELTTTRSRDRAWEAALARAETLAWSEVERAIGSGRGEGPVIRAAIAASAGVTLVIGNSLPIRTLDRFVPGGGASRRVISQRGANGIDGLVSGAVGVAMGERAPVLAIVGDVSFVHDLSALTALGSLRTPLVVVVIDNDGGRIFESLPIARGSATTDAMPLFVTPHGIDLSAVARAFGVACVTCVDARETSKAVSAALVEARATVVRAVVDPHDAFESFAALTRAFDARITEGAT